MATDTPTLPTGQPFHSTPLNRPNRHTISPHHHPPDRRTTSQSHRRCRRRAVCARTTPAWRSRRAPTRWRGDIGVCGADVGGARAAVQGWRVSPRRRTPGRRVATRPPGHSRARRHGRGRGNQGGARPRGASAGEPSTGIGRRAGAALRHADQLGVVDHHLARPGAGEAHVGRPPGADQPAVMHARFGRERTERRAPQLPHPPHRLPTSSLHSSSAPGSRDRARRTRPATAAPPPPPRRRRTMSMPAPERPSRRRCRRAATSRARASACRSGTNVGDPLVAREFAGVERHRHRRVTWRTCHRIVNWRARGTASTPRAPG